LTPIPLSEPAAADGTTGRPTLRRPASGPFVKVLQQKLGLTADGDFGSGTEASVREFQRHAGLVPDGIVGPGTWAALDRA
jgi:peptidoglycan hydrolase-like protein with peptidoglycan-binding domain